MLEERTPTKSHLIFFVVELTATESELNKISLEFLMPVWTSAM